MKFLNFKFILLFCVTTALVLAQKKKKDVVDKNCSKEKFDEHSSNVFGQFGLPELEFPDTTKELTTYCKKAKASTDFSKQYGQNCLTSTSQTLMSLANYNFDKVNKQYCAKNGKLKAEWVRWAKCGNKAKSAGSEKCWDTMVLAMANAGKVVNSKSRIPIVCCTYYEWIKCTRNVMEKLGEAVCPKDAVEGYSNYINKASVDAMNLICSRYNDDPVKCAALKKEVPNGRPKRLDKMPLLYIFDIFDKL